MTDTNNIAKIIENQYKFLDGSIFAEQLYDEILNATINYKEFEFCTSIDTKVKNPKKVFRSANFQYFIEGNKLILANKYFN